MSRWLQANHKRKAGIDMGQADVGQEAKINQALRQDPPAAVKKVTEESKVDALKDLIISKKLFDVTLATTYITDDGYDIDECLNYIEDCAEDIIDDPEIQAIISTNSKILDIILNKKGEIKHYLGEILKSNEDVTEHEHRVFAYISDTIDDLEDSRDLGTSYAISTITILLIWMLIAACKKIFK